MTQFNDSPTPPTDQTPTASLRERTLKGLAWTGIQNWLRQGVTFIVMLVLTRLLDPEDFGIAAFAYVFMAAVNTFVHLGFPDALIQERNLERLHEDTAFWIQMASSSLLTCGFWIASFIMIHRGWPDELPYLLQWFSVGLLLEALGSVQSALLRREFRFRELAIPSTAGSIIGGVFGVVCAVLGYGPWALVGQSVSGGMALLLLLWLLGRWRPRLAFSLAHARQLVKFGGGIVSSNIVGFFVVKFQDLMIGGVLGQIALGYYNVAARLLSFINNTLTQVVSPVVFVSMSELQHDLPRLSRALGKSLSMMAAMLMPACAALAVWTPLLIPLLFGEKWRPSVPLMQVLCLTTITWSLGTPLDQTMIAVGRPFWLFWLKLCHAVLSVVLLLTFVHWGLFVVVVAYTVRSYVLLPVQLVMLRRFTGFGNRQFVLAIVRPTVAAIIMGGTIWLVQWKLTASLNDVVRLMIGGAVAAVVYVAILWLIDRATVNEFIRITKGAVGRLAGRRRRPT